MSTKYEKIVSEDLDVGTGNTTRTHPGGGTMVGTKINGASVIPQLTQTEIDALTPTDYMIVINTTTQKLNFYNTTNSTWNEICDGVL